MNIATVIDYAVGGGQRVVYERDSLVTMQILVRSMICWDIASSERTRKTRQGELARDVLGAGAQWF